jgi:hypothetical protein
MAPLLHPYCTLIAPLLHPYGTLMAPLWHPYGTLMAPLWLPYGTLIAPLTFPHQVRTTLTQPRFSFAYSPSDFDTISMVSEGMIEPAITRAWHATTHQCCSRGGSVLDVGGNYGW